MMIGIYILGFYCFFASIFGPVFAKCHISFPFFNFPVFIGEIVLLICLIISGWFIYTKKIRLTKLQCLFLGYLGLIILWAGYECFRVNGSPLALRNAVLFFYPIFAFFAYSFYGHSLFSKKRVQLLLAVLLMLLPIVSDVHFFSFIYFILFFAALYAGVPGSWRYAVMAVALVLWPYSSFLSGARTWFVSSILTSLFLIFLFVTYFLEFKKSWKMFAGITAGVIFLLAAFHFSDKIAFKTLMTPMKVIEGYKKVKALIKEKEPLFHSQNLSAHLYNDQLEKVNRTPLKYQGPSHRDVGGAYNDIYFRLLIWEDMIWELWESKSIFGVGLAHPQRSRNIEILNWASPEWNRDGWIAPHNSFLHLIYRAGIIGIGLIGVLFTVLGGLIRDFVERRSVVGVLLSGIIVYGFLAANFLLIFELPYYAIPFWSLFGLAMAYRRDLLENKICTKALKSSEF